jgi:hypothetical protein
MSDLTSYMAQRLPQLTGGDQQPGATQNFWSEVFVAAL